jgi:hypothetical protein
MRRMKPVVGCGMLLLGRGSLVGVLLTGQMEHTLR